MEVVDGCVTLRGQVGRSEVVRRARDAVADVPGVTDVISHSHLPKTDAPNMADSLGATPPREPHVVHHGA